MEGLSFLSRIPWSIYLAAFICFDLLFSYAVFDHASRETPLGEWFDSIRDAQGASGMDDSTGRRLGRMDRFVAAANDFGLFRKPVSTESHQQGSVTGVHPRERWEAGGGKADATALAAGHRRRHAAAHAGMQGTTTVPAVSAAEAVEAVGAVEAVESSGHERHGGEEGDEFGGADNSGHDDDDNGGSFDGTAYVLKMLAIQSPRLLNTFVKVAVLIFARVYKSKVVDKKPKLGPAPKGRVTVPDGVSPGSPLTVAMPDGRHVQMIVPQGVHSGEALEFEFPFPGPGITQTVFGCTEDCDICWMTFCCFATRIADTYASAGVCGFWPAFWLAFCCPCFTAACMAPCKRAEIRSRLGGDRRDVDAAECCLVFWCWACVTCQEARAVDAALGVRIKCCCTMESITEAKVPLVTTTVGESVLVAPSAPSLSSEIAYAQEAPASSTCPEPVVEGRPVATATPLQVAGRDVMMQDLTYQVPGVPARSTPGTCDRT